MASSNRTHHSITPEPSPPGSREPAPHVLGAQGSLSSAEIAERSASAATAAECRRWQVIGLLQDGTPLAEIVAATGCRPRTIRHIAQRYREFGPAALLDRRAHSQGAPPLLTPSLQHELWETLQHLPPGGGTWTGPRVAQWIAARTGQRVHRQRGWEYLLRFGGTTGPARAGPHADDDDRSS